MCNLGLLPIQPLEVGWKASSESTFLPPAAARGLCHESTIHRVSYTPSCEYGILNLEDHVNLDYRINRTVQTAPLSQKKEKNVYCAIRASLCIFDMRILAATTAPRAADIAMPIHGYWLCSLKSRCTSTSWQKR
jgi:hypothetical protein